MKSLNKDKNKINRKGEKVGLWEIYWDNGQIGFRGSYKNNKQERSFCSLNIKC